MDEKQNTQGAATSGLAIASFVLSLVFCLFIIGPVLSIVLGLIAIGSINRSEGRLQGKGLAVTGILISLCTLFLTIWGIQALRTVYQTTKPTVSTVLEAIHENNYQKATTCFHKSLCTALPEKKFAEIAQKVNKKMGKMQSFRWGYTLQYQPSPAPLMIRYVCDFEKARDAVLTVTFAKEDGKYKMAGFGINHEALLGEN
jgi:hypothetical protein